MVETEYSGGHRNGFKSGQCYYHNLLNEPLSKIPRDLRSFAFSYLIFFLIFIEV